jgi:xanthine/CO dehydrogenase XdhC/CoxF family maturation factor
MVHLFEHVVREARQNPRVALGIISHVKGSSPQKQGTKALFFHDDRMVGTSGCGAEQEANMARFISASAA